ncbi:hypothetical protein DRP53_05500 [candidate division WOR-3 bacterium]|uniref:Uncharacterized protein n=1 Tax=candidate division WOR-3 bacterium TaxID=2052148 RepID=A0A660SHI9_UNCW3|nr:MAG: hypothetical protein DRP53_05500 [candidate division WOR-3 bacterium]
MYSDCKGRGELTEEQIGIIGEVGELLSYLTAHDYATYRIVCSPTSREKAERKISEKTSRKLSSDEIETLKKEILDLCRENAIDEKMRYVSITKKEFLERCRRLERVLDKLLAEAHGIYEVAVGNYYYYLIFTANQIYHLSLTAEVHLD